MLTNPYSSCNINIACGEQADIKKCGSVGTGRRARLRILWLLQSCGFKSHLPHEERKKSRSNDLLFFRSLCRGVPCPQGPRSPRHKCLVGRFDGKQVPRTYFLIRLTPSSAVKLSAINKAKTPYLSHFLFNRKLLFFDADNGY